MKIIDLLNKIANGEEVPKKIKFENNIFVAKGNGIENFVDYVCDDLDYCFTHFVNWTNLNDKVEILEGEKKIPEKLDYIHPDIQCSYNESELLLRIEANKDKINEIIDYLEYLKSKGDE